MTQDKTAETKPTGKIQKKLSKRALTDWSKKNSSDRERINEKIDQRAQQSDYAPVRSDSHAKTLPPQISGTPLLRLRTKIREVYDEEDEEEDEYTPFFNISLLNEQFEEEQQKENTAVETVRITKQQQLAERLNIIMNSALAAQKAGLNPEMTAQDARLADSPEYSLKKIRRKTIKEKIEKPLGLKGEIPEKKLSQTVKAIKKARKTLPPDTLKGMPAEDVEKLNSTETSQDMARLILKKSGRTSLQKPLAQIIRENNTDKEKGQEKET